MPTPAIAYLTRTFQGLAGIVISASHNAYHDNGIKFFDGDGGKLPDDVEAEIEAEIDEQMVTVRSSELGRARRIVDAAGRYIEFCKSTVPSRLNLRGMKIVVDCANGATYHVAPQVFTELGADVVAFADQPNGLNINDGVGAVHPQALASAVVEHHADLGVSFDGDGDRIVMVDNRGDIVDGDEILFVLADAAHREGLLRGDVIGTVMTNIGLEEALRERGIGMQRANVGDRYVLGAMRAGNCSLGGEASGHIICLDKVTTGDAIVAALQVVHALREQGVSLREARAGFRRYPQLLRNVRLKQRREIDELPGVIDAVALAEAELGSAGRVLLRLSGTEPLLRVMVEGRDDAQVERLTSDLVTAVERSLA